MREIAYLRLENVDDNHYKFYEMTLEEGGRDSTYDVVVRYGRIDTRGKTIYLRGKQFPNNEARNVTLLMARRGFLDQLKKKFRDKNYTLVDLNVQDHDLGNQITNEIEDLQWEFEGSSKMMVRLEDRGF